MTPQDYVQQKAAASGSSFYYAFLFLPPQKRAAITAFYAFCREIDDVVDDMVDPSVASSKLAWWQAEVAQSFAGQPSHPVLKALMPLAAEFKIEERHLQSVIDGCQMDLVQTRYLDYPGLRLAKDVGCHFTDHPGHQIAVALQCRVVKVAVL